MNSEIAKALEEIEIGLYDKAKARIFSSLKKDPFDPYVLNSLGLLYLSIGDVKTADRLFQKAKQYVKDFKGLKKNIETIERIKAYKDFKYTFLIYIPDEKNLVSIWKNKIKKIASFRKNQYFILLSKPSSFTLSFLKKYKIPAIIGSTLTSLVNRGFMEKRGERVVFAPFFLLDKLHLLIKEDPDLVIIKNNASPVAFSLKSSKLYEKGILRKDLKFEDALSEYINKFKDSIEIIEEEFEQDLNIRDEDKSKISLCMIVKDEEENIGRCLASVKDLVDEIIIVDTGSKDRTSDIAKEFGAKVFYLKWKDDFSLARNESIKHATYPWIMWLDADDYIKDEDKADFLKFKKILHMTEYMAFRMPTLSIRKGIFIKKDVNYLTRIFRNLAGIKFEGKIHEQVLPSISRLKGKVGTANIPIYHTGYEDSGTLIRKKQRNKKILEKAVREEPENPIYLTYLGRTYMEEWLEGRGESIEKAEELLKKAIELFPHTETNYLSYAYLNLSLIYYHTKRFEKAIEYAKEAIKINKDIESAYEVYGRSLMFMGRFQEAEKVFLQMEKNLDRESPAYISISDFDYRYFLGFCQFNLGKYRESIENLKRVSANQKERENIDFYIGTAYYKLKDYKNAILHLKMALEKDSHHYDTWNNLGNIYLAMEDLDSAEDCYLKALSIKHGKEALFSLGYLYYKKDEYGKAKEYFNRLINISHERDPLYEKALFYLSNLFFIEEDYKNALHYIENIDAPHIIGKEYYLLAEKIYKKANALDKAGKTLAQGLSIYKYDPELMMLFGEVLELQNKYPEAISVYEELIKIKKESQLMHKLGILYAKLGLFKEAIKYFEEILKINPKNIDIYNDLGVFYGLTGDLDKAETLLKKALNLDPSNKMVRANLDRILSEKNKKNL